MDAAAVLFREIGYDRTTMRAIALKVGVSATAIYWYFRSKREMALELLESILRDFVSNAANQAGSGTAEVRLRNVVSAHVKYVLLVGQIPNQMYNALLSVDGMKKAAGPVPDETLIKWQRRYIRLITDIIQHGNETGEFDAPEPTATAFAIVNMCDYVIDWFRPRGRLTVTQLADHYADLAARMAGLHGQPPAGQSQPGVSRGRDSRVATL